MTRPTRHLVLVSAPLPECALCEAPTKRDVHEALHGLCSTCNTAAATLAARIRKATDRREAVHAARLAVDLCGGQLTLDDALDDL